MGVQTRTVTNEDTDPKKRSSAVLSEKDSLDPEKFIETTEAGNVEAYAKELAFLQTPVEVMIAPSHDPEDTTKLVDISVNGTSYYFLRGEWRKVPLFVLEILAKAKHQAWNFGIKQLSDGRPMNTQDSSMLLRYPHQYRSQDPKVHAYYDSIKDKWN